MFGDRRACVFVCVYRISHILMKLEKLKCFSATITCNVRTEMSSATLNINNYNVTFICTFFSLTLYISNYLNDFRRYYKMLLPIISLEDWNKNFLMNPTIISYGHFLNFILLYFTFFIFWILKHEITEKDKYYNSTYIRYHESSNSQRLRVEQC